MKGKYILNQGILKVVFTSEKTIKYIAFKYNLNPNFQIKLINGESSIPNNSIPDFLTREFLQDSQDHGSQNRKAIL